MAARTLGRGEGEGANVPAKALPGSTWPQRSPFSVRRLTVGDTRASAQLHEEVLGAEFVGRAGPRFLRLYHLAWCRSPGGLALGATNSRGELVGVLLGSLDPAAHYRYMTKRYGAALAACLLGHAALHPGFARELLATRVLRYLRGAARLVARRRGPARGAFGVKEGEITHLMVAPASRGAGAGRALVQEALHAAQASGLDQLVLVTFPEPSSSGFYLHLGWLPYGEVTSRSGERFARYRWPLRQQEASTRR
jgi:GNAT superfamily N-acetyltransferase